MKYFYEEYKHIIFDKSNVTFFELLKMNETDFDVWVSLLRKAMLVSWDRLGIPPGGGVSEDKIIADFKRLNRQKVLGCLKHNDETGEMNIVNKIGNIGSTCNQFFPALKKTPVNSSAETKDGVSLYTYIKNEKKIPEVTKTLFRNFKRDSFSVYSKPVKKDLEMLGIKENKGSKWLKAFRKTNNNDYDVWFECRNLKTDYLTITKGELELLGFEQWQVIADEYKNKKHDTPYAIRVFKKNDKLFPIGIGTFHNVLGGLVTNFPPTIAKWIYTTYTEPFRHQDRIIIYDCSCGWGGRILAAMSVNDRPIHYVGTDPNSANWIPFLKMTRYEYLADFFNNNVKPSKPNTYEIFRCGSEVIDQDPSFQKYKGKIDLVFTSPPYFAKEIYSTEKTQSCHKFRKYEQWREGFLRKTLETCAEYLAPGGYLLWNIADVNKIPLEKDSCDILDSLGLKHEKTLYLVQQNSPGAHRRNDDGVLTTKNQVVVAGLRTKCEPLFVYRKPQ